jgi:Fuc2NAc and GlcNAc transferase
MIYVVIAILSAFLTYLIRFIALKKAILDIPNHRSSHQTPTPRGGGLAIVIAFFGALLWMYNTEDIDPKLFYALLTSLPIALTGFLDDIVNLPASGRLIIQVLSAAAALYFLNLEWYLFVFGLFLVVWFTNLFNFLDGIDGYVSVETLFITVAAYLFFHNPLFLILGASVAGFLPFNWQKASIFMGDVGSTFIGFVIAVFFLYYATTIENVFIWLLLTSPFWFDATYTLIRRFLNGEKITQAHRKHLFQRAVQSGFSHRSVTLGLLGIDLLLLGVLLFWGEYPWRIVLLFGVLYAGIAYFIEKRVRFHVA